MTETGWGPDLQAAPRKKSAMPVWAWACGGGCLLFGAALVLAIWLSAKPLKEWINELKDPEVQWTELAQVLPLRGERPDYRIVRLPIPFLRVWTLRERQTPFGAHVMTGPRSKDANFNEWYDHPERSPVLQQRLRDFRAERGHITIAGRDFECMRYIRSAGDSSAVRELAPPDEPLESDATDEADDAGESGAPEDPAPPQPPTPAPGAPGESGASTAPGRPVVTAIAFEIGGTDDERVLLSLSSYQPDVELTDDAVNRFLEPFDIRELR